MVEVADHFAAGRVRSEVVSATFELLLRHSCSYSRSLLGLARQILQHSLLMILCRITAIVARMMAAFSGEHFAKVLKHLRSSTIILVHAVLNNTTQVGVLLLLLLLGLLILVDHLLNGIGVAVAEEEDAGRALAVSACSACLLVVAFEGLRERVVHHEADVALVDAHSKGNGSHDDA